MVCFVLLEACFPRSAFDLSVYFSIFRSIFCYIFRLLKYDFLCDRGVHGIAGFAIDFGIWGFGIAGRVDVGKGLGTHDDQHW